MSNAINNSFIKYYNKKLNPLTLKKYEYEENIKAFQEYWMENDSEKKNFELGRLRISLTEQCNFKCPFCYNEGMAKGANSFNVKEISAILEASKGIAKSIKLTGGEPLLNNDILEIIELSSKEFPTSITTNGSILNKISNVADKLSGITVSIQSVKDINYKELMGTNYTPNNIIKNILDLKKISNVPISVNMVVNKMNTKDLKNYINQMTDIGIKTINLIGMLVYNSFDQELYYPLEKVKTELDIWFGKPEISTASRIKYEVNKNTDIQLVYQYCMIGCNTCRTDGFIRISPKPDISYCLTAKTILIEKEMKTLDILGIRKAILSAIDLLGKNDG